MFHNQVILQNIRPANIEAEEYGSQINEQQNLDRNLQPHLLNSSNFSTFQQNLNHQQTEPNDQIYSTVNSYKYPQTVLQHQTLPQQDNYYSDQNDENQNCSNQIIKPIPIKVDNYINNHQKLQPQHHSISQTTQHNNSTIINENPHQQQQQQISNNYNDVSLQNNSKQSQQIYNQNDSITYGLSRTPTNQSQELVKAGGQLQDECNIINVEKENEVIKLDKHYKQILKTEKDEYERKLVKIQQQAEKAVEKKFKYQINDLKSKLENYESMELQVQKLKSQNDKQSQNCEKLEKKKRKLETKCLRQEEQLKVVQKKLDDLWERQNLEKENIKLVQKFEVENESRKVINDLTMKVIDLEKQLKDKILESDLQKHQMEKQRQDLLNQEHSFSKYINKSQDNIIECENQILKSQNRQLQDQLQLLELELTDKNQKLIQLQQESMQRESSDKLLVRKYESLKRKFALMVKEKEQINANKLLETAKFKESVGAGQNQQTNKFSNNDQVQVSEFQEEDRNEDNLKDCKSCSKLKGQIQEIVGKYFEEIKQMRTQITFIKQQSRESISNGQREMHQTIIRKLREYLDKIKQKSEKEQTTDIQISLKNKQEKRSSNQTPAFDQRKGSVVVLSKNKNSLGQTLNQDNTILYDTIDRQNISQSQGNLTDRGILQSRRYTHTIDNIQTSSTLEAPLTHKYVNTTQSKTIQERSQLLSAKLDQIQNTFLHKTIGRSTQRSRKNQHLNIQGNISTSLQGQSKTQSFSLQNRRDENSTIKDFSFYRYKPQHITEKSFKEQKIKKKKRSKSLQGKKDKEDAKNKVSKFKKGKTIEAPHMPIQNSNITSLRNRLNKF